MADQSKLNIDEFSFGEIKGNPTIAMIAKRESGKSWITKAFIFENTDIPVGVIISNTEECNPFYSEFFPSTYIYFEFKTEILERLLARQNHMIKKARDKKEQGKFLDPRALFIMDDCLADGKKWINDSYLKDIFMNGRHRQITYILTMQFPLGITPSLRSNFDYIFLLREDQASNLKRIYDHWAPITDKFKDFREIFEQLTQNHGAMVYINRNTSGTELTDKIKWYKAPNLEGHRIKFGCKQFRKYHEKNYDPDWYEKKNNAQYGHIMNNNFSGRKKRFDVRKNQI